MSLYLRPDRNMISWFEIPVLDFQRAKKFYSAILNIEDMQTEQSETHDIGFFTLYKNKVSGAIVRAKGYEPSKKGPLLYLNADPSMDQTLARIEENGGKIIVPKTVISKTAGCIARFEDLEGNLLALHAKN